MHKSNCQFFDPLTQKWKKLEVLIDKKLNYDYSKCKWIAIDGEFTGLYPQRDDSTVWTICSEDEQTGLRVEMLYTYNNDADISGLKSLISSDIEKYFYYGRLDLAYLYKMTGIVVSSPIFDVKLSSVVIRTHTTEHGLKSLIKTYVNQTEDIIDKSVLTNIDWVTDYKHWNPLAFQYNVNDVIYLKYLADKLKELAKKSKKVDVVNSVNIALPHLATIYANGFYRNIFKHSYNDTDMQE